MIIFELLGTALDVLTGVLYSAFSTIKTLIEKVYDIGKDITDLLTQYMGYLVQNFPFDNPSRTLGLSLIWSIIVLALILFFSGEQFTHGGVKTTDKQVNVDLDRFGIGVGGGKTTETTTTNPPVGPTTTTIIGNDECYTDADCQGVGVDAINLGKCCYKSEYDGYSCAGKCLRDASWDRDVCKHPNACYLTPFPNNRMNDITSNMCILKNLRDSYCQNRVSETTDLSSICCDENTQPMGGANVCYGFCLLSGKGYDCDNPYSCEEERPSTPDYQIISGGDI